MYFNKKFYLLYKKIIIIIGGVFMKRFCMFAVFSAVVALILPVLVSGFIKIRLNKEKKTEKCGEVK